MKTQITIKIIGYLLTNFLRALVKELKETNIYYINHKPT